jgi:6-phosphogluconolactonase (cycloisomerase 2 family)
MKFSKLSQLILVSTIGLFLASYLTACQIVTIDYVFVAASSGNGNTGGEIYTFAADAESGALRTGAPAVSTGGNSPVSMAVTADYFNLYVANQGSDSVVHFSIAGNGVLTKKDSVTTTAPPVAVYANAAGTYLYVLTGTNTATLTEYALSSGAIGGVTAQQALTIPGFASDIVVPTAVTSLPNSGGVYAAVYDQSAYNPGGITTSNANPGWLFGFSVGSGGALTATADSPYQAGVKPSALAASPNNRFVYATDFASNQLIGYTVLGSDELNFIINGPFKTGNEPSSILVDPRDLFIYVSNSLDSTVSAYNIALPTGIPSAAINPTSSQAYSTDPQPLAIAIDPALGRYIYTANHLGNSVSGFRLNPSTGVLAPTQATPYPTGFGPTAILAVPHGNHAIQLVSP